MPRSPTPSTRPKSVVLLELAGDLGFGIATLHTAAHRDRLLKEQLTSAATLKDAFIGTIEAMGLMAEKRDPYTAGHQVRVAELATHIAQELGWDANRIEGLNFGALIYDIGKVYIPSDILNRPGKLTALEFDMIKTHPQVGYDIVKNAKFPWPIAQMILQHHERLDGSGYPQGLKGDAISAEAQIIAVADTLEAMTSHRPYRAALGVELALALLEKERGVTYNAEAVDACLKLVREKGLLTDLRGKQTGPI